MEPTRTRADDVVMRYLVRRTGASPYLRRVLRQTAHVNYLTIALAAACISVLLRNALPVLALGPAMHDDLLFVRLAEYLQGGRWLGAYDNLTLAKGAFYSG